MTEQSILVGRYRVLTQDLEFGIAQIVEIAIRALSPAINDTFTGIACVDLLEEALMILAEAPACGGRLYSADGSFRLQVRPLLIPRLIKQAFDQIRQAATDNPAVLIRILTTLGRLTPTLHRPEENAALMKQAAAVRETATSSNPVSMDRDDIDCAWRKTHDLFDERSDTENDPTPSDKEVKMPWGRKLPGLRTIRTAAWLHSHVVQFSATRTRTVVTLPCISLMLRL